MDEQRHDDQLEPIYNSSESIQDVALKTYRERWTIETGGERESVISVLAARHHDDYDDYYFYFYYLHNNDNNYYVGTFSVTVIPV